MIVVFYLPSFVTAFRDIKEVYEVQSFELRRNVSHSDVSPASLSCGLFGLILILEPRKVNISIAGSRLNHSINFDIDSTCLISEV